MKWKKVVAIIRSDKLREVEERLKYLQVGGISVTRGAGYGEYANLLSQDWCVTHARLEIYCEASRADVIGQAIIDAAHYRVGRRWHCGLHSSRKDVSDQSESGGEVSKSIGGSIIPRSGCFA